MKNIVLIGFMGCGKTEVGNRLSERLGYTFVDTDKLIEKKAGKSIAEIFREHGESYFRDLEALTVREFSGKTGYVISTGGGIVINPENIMNLKKEGFIVWLNASPETIYKRIASETHRPLLNIDNPLEEIKRLLGLREKLYARADMSVDTDELDVDKIVDVIIEKVDSCSRRL